LVAVVLLHRRAPRQRRSHHEIKTQKACFISETELLIL